MTSFEDIQSDFAILDDWEDRYRYVIELGRQLPELPEALRTDANKVRGCASQVWLATRQEPGEAGGPAVLHFSGDSDAHIVRGLIAILFVLFTGRTPQDILAIDANDVFHRIGLDTHLTPQRSNGLQAMVQRIRAHAAAALAEETR